MTAGAGVVVGVVTICLPQAKTESANTLIANTNLLCIANTFGLYWHCQHKPLSFINSCANHPNVRNYLALWGAPSQYLCQRFLFQALRHCVKDCQYYLYWQFAFARRSE